MRESQRAAAQDLTLSFGSNIYVGSVVVRADRGFQLRKEGRERQSGDGEMKSLRLKELSNSDLYRRRQERPDSYGGLARDSLR